LASNGEHAIELARELQPDVTLVDIEMPGINGIEATREILHLSPRVGVLVVTMFEDDSVFAAMRAGTRGYLLKDSRGKEVRHAIRAVASGEAIFGPGSSVPGRPGWGTKEPSRDTLYRSGSCAPDV
jgi:DNA-binding NarL/FixJ family response regulator